jgi:hypothetical protein
MRVWRRSVLQIDKRLAQFHRDWTRRSPASSPVGIRRFEPPDRDDDCRGTVGEYLVTRRYFRAANPHAHALLCGTIADLPSNRQESPVTPGRMVPSSGGVMSRAALPEPSTKKMLIPPMMFIPPHLLHLLALYRV